MKYDFIIRGTIGSWWSGTTAEDLRYFLNRHKDEDLVIGICSPGGYVSDGLEMYQLLRDHGRVTGVAYGMTASSATIALMGCKTVKMAKNSLMLIHNASTGVLEWGRFNKEQLDELIKKLNKDRKDLDTIDKVIASIYSDRNGKTVDENLQKMKAGMWLSDSEAREWGLCDEILDEEVTKQAMNSIHNDFTNSIIKEMGLPTFTSVIPDDNDSEGAPAKGVLQKTVDAIKGLFHNEPAKDLSNKMKKVFKNVCDLLKVEDIEVTDSKVTLTEDQMQTVEDQLAKQATDLETANSAKATAEAQVTDLQTKLDKAQEDIKNLKQTAGGDQQEHAGQDEDETAVDFNAARALYNAVSGENI